MSIINKLKKFKKETSLSLTVLIVLGIVAILNFFAYQLFIRFDLTKNKDYSLSQISKDTVKNLDDIVTIKAYFSKELPAQYVSLPQDVKDVLDGYQSYSKGKIKFEFIDPTDNKDLQSQLQIKGIPQLQFNVLTKDKYQVVNGYIGMSLDYGDKSESIPVIQDTNNLEYLITSNIKKLTSKSMPIVGYLTSNGTLDVEKDIAKSYKSLSDLYQVRQINLLTDKKIPDDIKTLVVAGPKEKFNTDEQKAIDNFIIKGGSLLLLDDGVKVDNGLAASNNDVGLDKFLENYGIKLNHNLVLDNSAGQASFNQGFVTFMVDYPFWPKILTGGFDKNSAVTSKLESLTLPWASSIDVIADKIDASDKISYFLKSTNQAWLQSGSYNLNPQQNFLDKQQTGQYNLAVSITGKINSQFGQGSSANSRIIVVGDSDFLKDGFLPAGNNLTFFQNMVDSLSLDEALINIRSKGVTDHPITNKLTDNDKQVIRYANVFALTIIIVGFGLFRYYSRRKNRFFDEF